MLIFILLFLSINVFVLMFLLIMCALISALMYSACGVSRQMGVHFRNEHYYYYVDSRVILATRIKLPYFQHLLSLIYETYDDDFILMCGDYNPRVGRKNDLVDSVDDLPLRVVLDTTTNDHGTSLVNLCVQAKMCIINGRICPLNDGFTFEVKQSLTIS